MWAYVLLSLGVNEICGWFLFVYAFFSCKSTALLQKAVFWSDELIDIHGVIGDWQAVSSSFWSRPVDSIVWGCGASAPHPVSVIMRQCLSDELMLTGRGRGAPHPHVFSAAVLRTTHGGQESCGRGQDEVCPHRWRPPDAPQRVPCIQTEWVDLLWEVQPIFQLSWTKATRMPLMCNCLKCWKMCICLWCGGGTVGIARITRFDVGNFGMFYICDQKHADQFFLPRCQILFQQELKAVLLLLLFFSFNFFPLPFSTFLCLSVCINWSIQSQLIVQRCAAWIGEWEKKRWRSSPGVILLVPWCVAIRGWEK